MTFVRKVNNRARFNVTSEGDPAAVAILKRTGADFDKTFIVNSDTVDGSIHPTWHFRTQGTWMENRHITGYYLFYSGSTLSLGRVLDSPSGGGFPSANFTMQANTDYVVRIRMDGFRIRVAVWLASGSQDGWMFDHVDQNELFSSGRFAFKLIRSGGTGYFDLDEYKVIFGGTVQETEVTGVTVTGSTSNLQVGVSRQFEATVQGTNVSQSVTWTATNGTITSSGSFTASGTGSCSATATSVDDPNQSTTVNFEAVAASASEGDSRADDEFALSELYESTNGGDWHNNTGWNGGDVSLIEGDYNNGLIGVRVEEVNGELRVTGIDMQKVTFDSDGTTSGNNLTGTLKASLGNLKQLTDRFNVKQNKLVTEIPEQIENWTKLKRLSLAGQGCELDLDHRTSWHENNHRGCQPTSLGKRFEDTNTFTGPIPPTIGNMQSLELLEIRRQRLTGTLPSEIGQLTSLKGIFLNDQRGSNALGGQLPDGWGGLVNLVWLKLNNGAGDGVYSGEVPADWQNWTSIRNIEMDYNDLTGPAPIFPNATDIHYINFGNNSFTGDFPMDYFSGKNSWMSKFVMSFNNLSGQIPEMNDPITTPANNLSTELGYYYYMGDFNIGWNNFTGPIPEWIQKMDRAILVRVTANEFTGPFPKTLAESSRLRHLRIQDNKLSGDLPDVNWNSSNLGWIKMDNNNFTGTIPESWESIYENNKDSNGNYTGIHRRFRANDNELEGPIPEWMTKITTYEQIRLQNNKFTFKDLIEHHDHFVQNVGEYIFSPQKEFGSQDALTGSTIDFSDWVSHEDNVYEWRRNGNVISGETGRSIDTSSHGSGDYQLRVTNPNIPSLTLNSVTIGV